MSETRTDPETDRDAPHDDRRTTADYDSNTMKWVSMIVALVGLWIAASPFVYSTTEMATWNNVLVGLAIAVIAGYNFYRMSDNRVGSPGSASLVALLGLWTIAAPFIIEIQSETLGWSNVVAGAVVAIVAGYNAYESRRAMTPAGTRT